MVNGSEQQVGVPRLAVSMGDPAGIGPELCLRLLADDEIGSRCLPLVYGDMALLCRAAERTGLPRPQLIEPPTAGQGMPATAGVIQTGHLDASSIVPGEAQAAGGASSAGYIKAAVAAAQAGQVAAVVTAPISKLALDLAGIAYPGHTEMIADLTGTRDVCMMMTSPELTVSLVTWHLPIRQVAAQLTEERVVKVLELTRAAVQRLRSREPRLLCCGLNPHAGEQGVLGHEETRVLAPALQRARSQGIDCAGPVPADTAFLPSRRREVDAVVCMYHDQGLIPFKMLAFDHGVNVTLGCPIVRTSPDHGTAYDLAWQGRADPGSMRAAVQTALRLAGVSSA